MGNLIQLRRAGMGSNTIDEYIWDDLGNGGWINNPDYRPPLSSGPVVVQVPNPSATPAWIALLAGAEKTISNIFAPPSTSIAQAQGSIPYQSYQGSLQTVPRTSTTLGVTSTGVNLFGSTVGWVPILIIAGILFFPGFSRRK